MKKIIAISLVAIMAVGSVFAAISGTVETSLGYDFAEKEYGFFDLSKTNGEFTVDLFAATADTTPVAVEATEDTAAVEAPSIYAYVKANLSVKATIGEDLLGETKQNVDSSTKTYYASRLLDDDEAVDGRYGVASSDDNVDFGTPLEDGPSTDIGKKDVTSKNPYFDFNLVEAGVVGENWSLSILGTPEAPSFAKSFLDLDEDGDADDIFEAPYFGANGLEATIFGYKVGLGGHGKVGEGTSATAYVETPDYDFGVDGLTVAGAATYSHRSAVDAEDGVPGYGQYITIKSVDKDGNRVYNWDNWEVDPVSAKDADNHNLTFAGKVGYATDLVSATVATDLGVANLKKDREFGMDVAANVTYDFVAFDAYYGLKDRLDLQFALDLNKWAPVTFTLGVGDVATADRNLYGEVGTAIAGFEGKITGNVDLKANPGWELGVEASYNLENIAKFAISTSINEKSYWGMSISAENTTLIPGATLSLGWYDAEDLLQKNYGLKFKDKQYVITGINEDGNPVYNDKYTEAKTVPNHSDFGVIKASVKIEF